MHLSQTMLFQAKWTAAIHDEWIRNLLKNRPDLSSEQLERTRRLMDSTVRDCLIAGYEQLIPTLQLPDPDDRHVLAAAIACDADAIVTFNLQDFPTSILDEHSIAAMHPDDFVCDLCMTSPEVICETLQRHRLRLKRPAKSVEEYLSTLVTQGLTKTVTVLRSRADQL